MNTYIVQINPNEKDNIKKQLDIVWESKFLDGLVFIESNLSVEEVLSVNGVLSCKEDEEGTFYVELQNALKKIDIKEKYDYLTKKCSK